MSSDQLCTYILGVLEAHLWTETSIEPEEMKRLRNLIVGSLYPKDEILEAETDLVVKGWNHE